MWQWPEPHTGSSAMPSLGAKLRETQSVYAPGAVTCCKSPGRARSAS